MTALPDLDPELADLGQAIGLLTPDSSGALNLDSDWFSQPGPALGATLRDPARRAALVHFAEALLADGAHTERGGVTLLPVFDLARLHVAGPDLTVSVTIDDRNPAYVELGLDVALATTDPIVSRTDVSVPLYRASKTSTPLAQPFALLAGGVVTFGTDLTLSTATPPTDQFGLGGVALSVSTAFDGSTPTFALVLRQLHLPGAAAAVDVPVGGPGSSLEDSLLSLILGVVKQAAAGLGSGAAQDVDALLTLIGLNPADGVPALPVDDVVAHGVSALRTWFVQVVGEEASRTAWLGVLSQLLGGQPPANGTISVPLGIGPVRATIGLRAVPGPSGHLLVTPTLGLQLTPAAPGPVSVALVASVDVLTIDTSTGALTAVPEAGFVLTAQGNPGKLLDTTPVKVDQLDLGLRLRDGVPQFVLDLSGVDVPGHHFDLLDLSSPDAAAASAGHVAGALLTAALHAALGDPTATELEGLLGLTAPAGVTALDPARLLTDPLGAIGQWWRDLIHDGTHVQDVLGHLITLLRGPLTIPVPPTANGTAANPWTVPIVSRFSIDLYVEDGRLQLAPTLALRVDDLAGGCTVVLTSLRTVLVSLAITDTGFGSVHFPLAVDLDVQLRGRGATNAQLSLGSMAITADYLGVHASWSPDAGLDVGLAMPNLALDTGMGTVPIVLPTIAADGTVTMPDAAWDSVETLIGIFATAAPLGFLGQLAALAGWSQDPSVGGSHLSLADLVAAPLPTLKSWLGALATDPTLLASLTATVAHLTGGNSDGRFGVFSGAGTEEDPWLAALGPSSALPSLAVWLTPAGPVMAASGVGGALPGWRPGSAGLDPYALAQAVLDDAQADADAAALAAGRSGLGGGLAALAGRWVGTDGMVAPPSAGDVPPGLTVRTLPGLTCTQVRASDPATLVPGGLTADAAVLKIAIGTVAELPWAPAAGRLLDLTAPGLAPSAFTVAAPAAGEWCVALASAADAGLDPVSDPSGLIGQSGRLRAVIAAFGDTPVVLVAAGGAGHAARLAADAEQGVSQLITLGTPWSPATFDTARTGTPADAVRLLHALLAPLTGPDDPADHDLPTGRQLVSGFLDAARGTGLVRDLEAPRPTTPIRAGLTAVAAFGTLDSATVGRALTAVVAAGLAARAQARAGAASTVPDAAHLGISVPLPALTQPDGHGLTVDGSLRIVLGSIDRAAATITATPSIRMAVSVGRADGWLVGGPGTTPAGGGLPLELRRFDVHVDVGLFGGPSSAEVVLHEGAALGAEWVDLHIAPPADASGAIESLPLLPEARAALAGLTAGLHADAAGSPSAILLGLLTGAGLCDASGALLPDGLTHLLHDPGAQLRAVLTVPATRDALLAALHGVLPALTSTGASVTVDLGPATITADLDARSLAVTAAGAEGLLHWSASATLTPAGPPALTLVLGDPATDPAALALHTQPVRAELTRPDGGSVALWPAPDVGGLAKLAVAVLPAEAIRLVLEGLRPLDPDVGTAIDALAGALGMLAAVDPANPQRRRAITAPVLLFENPGQWLGKAGVLAPLAGGAFDTDRVIDLLEALKPFVGLGGTPRGSWPVADGIVVSVSAGTDGPTLALAVDATAWLAGLPGRPPFAAALTAGITLPAHSAPRPSVELSLGIPDGAGGTSTPDHRKAVHLFVGADGVRVVIRPGTGADVELFPHPAGLLQLLGAGLDAVLPTALNALAGMSGDDVRTKVGQLVSAAGRGLGVATGTPVATFSGDDLRSLAAAPGPWLSTHLGSVVHELGTVLADALNPLLATLPGAPHAAVGGDGTLTLTVGGATLAITPSPFAITVDGTVAGLPVIGTAGLSLGLDPSGLTGFGAQLGPAALTVAGVTLRPILRVDSEHASGWSVELGLGLDGDPETDLTHRELLARWQSASGLDVITTAGGVPVPDPDGVARVTAAVEAVLDLVGGWVLGIHDVQLLLAKTIGPAHTSVFTLLDGTVLAGTQAAPTVAAHVLEGWPGKLGTVAVQLATAAPTVALGPFALGLSGHDDLLGVAFTIASNGVLPLTTGDLVLSLEVDDTWIDPTPSAAGIVLDLVHVSGSTITPAPGVEVNGVGVRLTKSSGPLLDAGVRLDSIAVHLFGSVVANTSGTPVFGGGVELELGGLGVPLGSGGGTNPVAQGIMHDAGGSGSPPRPAFSPAIAIQNHGDGTAVSLRAGTGDGPWYLPIQRAFGPVYLEQVGLGVTYKQGVTPKQLDMINLYLDGGVTLFGLSASVDKLRLGYQSPGSFFAPSSWTVDVDGFAISSNIGGLTLAGGLRKDDLPGSPAGVQYLGMLKLSYSGYGIDLFGGYAQPGTADGGHYASFFAFGVLHAPIGGPPAFFITGIGIGFGINRHLTTPDIEHIGQSPFMQALRASGPPGDPMQELETISASIQPAQGEYWVAAGISFTSFVLITGEIVVSVQFGDGLEIAILGLARTQLPTADLTLVSIELALLARFSSTEGTVLVQAQLTDNSWLLTESVRLTGGFAFQAWWKGPNGGQFVVTIGGYHPRFHHDGYPVVPRVGLSWQPIDNISIVGQLYFALCSEALMAGLDIEVAAHFGPAHAQLSFGGDAIVYFDPFWFSVEVHAEVNVGITIWLLFGSVDVELNFGIEVEVSGPPIYVTGHFSVCGFEVPFEFGDRGDPADLALDAATFAGKYLRGDSGAQVVQASVPRGAIVAGKAAGTDGTAKPPDGSAANPFRVVPEFQLLFLSTAPTENSALQGGGVSKSAAVSAPGLGVAPMYASVLDSTLTITFTADDPHETFDVSGLALEPRTGASFPKGVWGPAPNPGAPVVPAGDMVTAGDGLTVDAVLPDSEFTGAAPINYHQVELRVDRQRKPLPFVSGRTELDASVTSAAQLSSAADVLSAGDPDTALRFERAARVLAAGGSGATTVAALRGDRVAPPRFGSLADDLAPSPDAVSPVVTPVVVDRNPPIAQRFPPLVKAVLGVPHTLSLDAVAATTVADPSGALSVAVPSLAAVRSTHLGTTQAALTLLPRAATLAGKTLVATGAAPVTRLASAPIAAVANARPDPVAARTLATMSDALGDGAPLDEGQLAIVTVDGRPQAETTDSAFASGGATRVLCIGAGGRAMSDDVVGADGADATVALPKGTERVVFVALGTSAALPGAVAGWSAAQSLPLLGWGIGLAGGALVTAQGTRIRTNRERGDGGWVQGGELASAGRVLTTFTDPVDAIAVVVDDSLGGDAAAKLAMSLQDAERVLDATGAPLPPQVLVDGVRSMLLYEVLTTGPEPGVLVTGCGGGQLAGVVAGADGVAALAQLLTTTGLDAAVRPPLVGGPGARTVRVVLADGPTHELSRLIRPKRAPAKKAVAKKAVAKKAVAKKAPAKRKKATP